MSTDLILQGVPKKVFVYKKVDQYINKHFFGGHLVGYERDTFERST